MTQSGHSIQLLRLYIFHFKGSLYPNSKKNACTNVQA